MAITRQKKEEILTKTTGALSGTQSIAFVGFKGLTVAEVNAMRADLKKEGVRYTVVKKTLLKKALEPKGIEGTMPELPGEVAVAFLEKGDDVTATLRLLGGFIGKLKEKLAFLGAAVDGKYLSKVEAVQLSAIPSPMVLRGMFVNVINSPIQRFAIALGQVATKK